jgi:acetyl/propionyl-CoA carboxylase alpha subunit
VLGIRTTIPFFQWLVEAPEFRAARFDTAFLDDLLRERRPAFDAFKDEEEEELAVVAAAAHAFLKAAGRTERASAPGRSSGWRQAARLDGLR